MAPLPEVNIFMAWSTCSKHFRTTWSRSRSGSYRMPFQTSCKWIGDHFHKGKEKETIKAKAAKCKKDEVDMDVEQEAKSSKVNKKKKKSHTKFYSYKYIITVYYANSNLYRI